MVGGGSIIDDQQVNKARKALGVIWDATKALDKAADEVHKKVRDLKTLDDFMGFN